MLSIPLAFVGGYINLPTNLFKVLLGVVLLFSAARFIFRPSGDNVVEEPSRSTAISSGAVLGFFAGLTGTGGGIFLTPLLLLKRWATAKTAAAVSVVFILINSVAGLVGNVSSTSSFPSFALVMGVSAVLGGTAGSYLGSHRFDHTIIKRLLAVVLVIAGAKLIFT